MAATPPDEEKVTVTFRSLSGRDVKQSFCRSTTFAEIKEAVAPEFFLNASTPKNIRFFYMSRVMADMETLQDYVAGSTIHVIHQLNCSCCDLLLFDEFPANYTYAHTSTWPPLRDERLINWTFSSGAAGKRVKKDIQRLLNTPWILSVNFELMTEDMPFFTIDLAAPPGVYEGGSFLLAIHVPRDYPFKGPSVSFPSRTVPHVAFERDRKYTVLHRDHWSPKIYMIDILNLLRLNLAHWGMKPDKHHTLQSSWALELKDDDSKAASVRQYVLENPAPLPNQAIQKASCMYATLEVASLYLETSAPRETSSSSVIAVESFDSSVADIVFICRELAPEIRLLIVCQAFGLSRSLRDREIEAAQWDEHLKILAYKITMARGERDAQNASRRSMNILRCALWTAAMKEDDDGETVARFGRVLRSAAGRERIVEALSPILLFSSLDVERALNHIDLSSMNEGMGRV